MTRLNKFVWWLGESAADAIKKNGGTVKPMPQDHGTFIAVDYSKVEVNLVMPACNTYTLRDASRVDMWHCGADLCLDLYRGF